jgi:hypothetical protein
MQLFILPKQMNIWVDSVQRDVCGDKNTNYHFTREAKQGCTWLTFGWVVAFRSLLHDTSWKSRNDK